MSDDLRNDLELATRALDRVVEQAARIADERDRLRHELAEATERFGHLREQHTALEALYQERKSECAELARQFGAEVATTQKMKKHIERALTVAREHLANTAAHEAWCTAKGRCTYCDPINDVIEALTGEEH